MKRTAWVLTATGAMQALLPVLRNRLMPLLNRLVFLSSVVVACSSTGLAASINLPQTNYPYHHAGDDGDVRAGVPWDPSTRFVDNHDGTVTDKLTYLMWLKDPNCARTINYNPNGLGYSGSYDSCYEGLCYWGSLSWKSALDFIEKINLNQIDISACGPYTAGYTDWRMPNVNELVSLFLDYGPSGGQWCVPNTSIFGTRGDCASYWTSTAFAYDSYVKWLVNRPQISFDLKMFISDYPDYHPVWPVRSGVQQGIFLDKALVPQTGQSQVYDYRDDGAFRWGVAPPTPRFTDHGDGTVTDNLTGLMWQKEANCLGSKLGYLDVDGVYGDGRLSYANAYNYVSVINMNLFHQCDYGYKDWRLPNIVELRSLLDYSQHEPALPKSHPFILPKYYKLEYWSSTYTGIDFQTGETAYPTDGYGYIWPVREGMIGIPLPDGQKNYSYPAVFSPTLSRDPEQAKPIALGAFVTGDSKIQLKIGLENFNGPVDLYFAIGYFGFIPEFNSPSFYLVQQDNSLKAFSGTLTPWKTAFTARVNEQLFGADIPADSLPRGLYKFYLAATPPNSWSSYYVWETSLFLPFFIALP